MGQSKLSSSAQRVAQRASVIRTFIVCSCIVAIFALIGGFWGAAGFRVVGMAMGAGFMALCVIVIV